MGKIVILFLDNFVHYILTNCFLSISNEIERILFLFELHYVESSCKTFSSHLFVSP
jgi:hypothetical protein